MQQKIVNSLIILKSYQVLPSLTMSYLFLQQC